MHINLKKQTKEKEKTNEKMEKSLKKKKKGKNIFHFLLLKFIFILFVYKREEKGDNLPIII